MAYRGVGPSSTGAAMTRTDAELIVASGEDPAAFRELYDRWAQPLFTYFIRRVLDPEIAADLLAETFATAYECRGRFRDIGRPGGAWLHGIAARKLARFFRRHKVEMRVAARLDLQRPELDAESLALMAELIDSDERHALVREGLGRISEAERRAVELRVVHELSYEEVARQLRCSPAAARTRVHRGLAHLSELLEASS
jgi:RNA polymerase sigma factor (sigma-70 family)